MFEHLLPCPREVSATGGTCALTRRFKVFAPGNQEPDDAVARRLDEIRDLARLPLKVKPAPGLGRHMLCLAEKAPEEPAPKISVPEARQAYALHVREDGVFIAANDALGLFYGLTTLSQMMEDSPDAKALACCEISDWPAIPIRGHFDDISRKRVSTTEDFLQIVQELGRLKVNYYSLYLEDVLHLRAFPDIGRTRGKLMPGEVAEIVGEARANGVEVIPFFQLIGHCENLLAMPNYERLGKPVKQRMSSLDPGNPEVREYLALCIEEVCGLFPCEYFGMGFDETQGIDGDMYIRHANWCAAELKRHGKKALLWADMFFKTFSIERARELDPNIILVNWNYGCTEKVPWQDELEALGRPVWGFGGYQNVCTHLPDFESAKRHADTWSSRMARNGAAAALLYSQWGDDGYENSRDLCWNLFAYAAETSWRGDNARKDTFEKRFQRRVMGCELPVLADIVKNFPAKIKHSGREYWRLHRLNANACLRLAASLESVESYEHDLNLINETLEALEDENTRLEKRLYEHGWQIHRHFCTALHLQKLNALKILTASGFRRELDDIPEDQLDLFTGIVRQSREIYISDWMLNNRREGLEVSTRVFDEVAASFEELLASHAHTRKGFVPLDLGAFHNTLMLDIGGIPIHDAALLGVPFRFAGVDKTFVKMDAACKTLSIPLAGETPVRDLHLIAASPMRKDLAKTPLLRLRLSRGGAVVWEDVLNATEHVCDWWAPAGEHIWAGGGYRFTDPARVFPACVPNLYYGLAVIQNFPRLENVGANQLEMEWLGPAEICVFAATLRTR
ncbi:MAG: beta-N-acetylhexosaminidase [Kiritimatiellaeota bacterium]|nr:beta-N-acetylhexosaminidase [Kiritimatiellota bacterium]